MLRLIRRELEDHMLLMLGAAIIATIFVCVILMLNQGELSFARSERSILWAPDMVLMNIGYLIFLPLIFAAIGAAQMYADRLRKVPAFLVTLATSRGEILGAKFITGVIYILVGLVPIIVTEIILMNIYHPTTTTGVGEFYKIYALLFLGCLTGYSTGLLAGTSKSKVVVILGPIVAVPLLISLYVIKGLDWQSAGLFAVITVAVMVNVWQKYKTSSI